MVPSHLERLNTAFITAFHQLTPQKAHVACVEFRTSSLALFPPSHRPHCFRPSGSVRCRGARSRSIRSLDRQAIRPSSCCLPHLHPQGCGRGPQALQRILRRDVLVLVTHGAPKAHRQPKTEKLVYGQIHCLRHAYLPLRLSTFATRLCPRPSVGSLLFLLIFSV